MTIPVLEDSRRLTGPNLLTPGPGAVIDALAQNSAALVDRWTIRVRQMLDAVGWPSEQIFSREFSRGASLAVSAPIDALYAATEVNEWAFAAALADLAGTGPFEVAESASGLRETIATEVNPRLLALHRAAAGHGVSFIWDDDNVSVGMGKGSITWAAADLPDPDDVAWNDLFDIPIALVTGSNGKTTTVRLLAAIAASHGKCPGFSSTDGVFVGGEPAESGDYSGPGGARVVLRDTSVEIAILETARGGLLRRGLGVPRADAAIVTNIAMDHLGEYGVDGLDDIADAKLVVERALDESRRLVLNAEDPTLADRFAGGKSGPTWYAVDSEARSNLQAWVSGDMVCFRDGGVTHDLARVADIPITIGGAAQHNVSNVLGAICVARLIGLPLSAIREGLLSFQPDVDNSPGRTNVFRAHGTTIIVDFAHNPEGLDALVAMVQQLPSERVLLVIGQAGDRDDESIRAFARSGAKLEADRIIVKEMEKYLRGRALGVVPAIIEDELGRVSARQVVQAASELQAVNDALAWAKPGDVLVLLTHEDRPGVLKRVQEFVGH